MTCLRGVVSACAVQSDVFVAWLAMAAATLLDNMPDLNQRSANPGARAAEDPGDVESRNVLEDLLLQAEIFVQYGMKSRALERAERLARQFPGEENQNERLRSLYASLGFQPGGSAPAPSAEAPEEAIVDITRISEITRNIFRQSSVRTVLSTAVNDIGRSWRVSRCVAGLCTPGKAPTAAVEYFAPGFEQSDVKSIVLVITACVAAASGGAVAVDDIAVSQKLPALVPLRQSLGLQSLLALPLCEAGDVAGVLVMEQCGRLRRWRPNDVTVLKSLAEQVMFSAAHAKLRSMVRSLSLADERSGMLTRDAYINCLLAECERARKQKSELSVLLLQFTPRQRQKKEVLDKLIQEAAQLLTGRLRLNDFTVHYDTARLAIILPDTRGRDVFAVFDKLRRSLSALRVGDETPAVMAGMAEAILSQSMDAVDSVTELINRAETALEAAEREGEGAAKLLLRPGDA